MKYEIGKRIKFFREKAELSQKVFAVKIGVKSTRVSNWETGINRPDADLLKDICLVLNVSADELLGICIQQDNAFSASEIEHIKKYRQLDQRGQAAVDGTLSHEWELLQSEKNDGNCDLLPDRFA